MDRPAATDADAIVRRVLSTRAPLQWRDCALTDDLQLGSTGMGLDSVAIVELLLACEEALGVRIPPTVFDEGQLSVGRLIAFARQITASHGAT